MAFTSPSQPRPKTPVHVPATQEANEETFAPGEVLGTFTAWLRRPKANRQGLTAQFFGENGKDADVITIFFLDRFRDTLVDLRIWAIKAGSGKEFKNSEGKHLELPPFRARIKNPASTNEGLVAQFFAANGVAADAANELNKTIYLDSLVLVEVVAADEHEQFVPKTDAEMPAAELAQAASRLTPVEERELKKLQKKAQDAWRQLLQAGFFRKADLWRTLGGEHNYQQWLTGQGCCHPGTNACPNAPVQAFRVPVPDTPYPFVPLCDEHARLWDSGVVTLPLKGNPVTFLRQTHEVELVRWAQTRLREELKTPAGYIPSPKAVASWAMNHSLSLPDSFALFTI